MGTYGRHHRCRLCAVRDGRCLRFIPVILMASPFVDVTHMTLQEPVMFLSCLESFKGRMIPSIHIYCSMLLEVGGIILLQES